MNEQSIWIDIISKLYKDLHIQKRVMHVANESDKRRDRIIKYFNRLENVQNKAVERNSFAALSRLKKFYYDLYVIKPENIPDKYFENEIQRRREQGFFVDRFEEFEKNKLTEQIIDDQRKSLEPWIDYFLFDEQGKRYEMWEKFWVFQGLQQLGKFNKDTIKFSKRDKTTVYPFPIINKKAISMTIEFMREYIKDKTADDEIKSALGTGHFKTIYEHSLRYLFSKEKFNLNSSTGRWVKYNQGSDYNLLRNSILDYQTGWCTANGENVAISQLAEGDFYVYYSMDDNDEAKIPRIAIRMNGHNKIAEIRGIATAQNMEPEMLAILNEKLEEFPDREKFRKKEYDMQMLTTIDNKQQKGIKLTKEDLKYLYEINDTIDGFGEGEDPRIWKIKQQRNEKEDYALIYDCQIDDIALSLDELKQKKKKVFVGYLDLRTTKRLEEVILPDIVVGDLTFGNLTDIKGVKLPKEVTGSVFLNGITDAKGLILPEKINKNLHLDGLETAGGLELPQCINYSLYLQGLRSAKDLKLPEIVNGDLNLNILQNAKYLNLPKEVNGELYLNNIASAKDLKLPEQVNGDLWLGALKIADGLKLPEIMNGDINLTSLETAVGLTFPKVLNGALFFDVLSTAKDLILPEKINGKLCLNSLETAEDLKLPKEINGKLYLGNLSSLCDFVFSNKINGDIDLTNIQVAKNVEMPKIINGSVHFCYLKIAENITFPEKINGDLILSKLEMHENLKLPEKINGSLCFEELISVKGLKLPKEITGKLVLKKLASAEGLKLPYGFPLEKLECPENIKNEIILNPRYYYYDYREKGYENSENVIKK